MSGPIYCDLHSLSEDRRIDVIAHQVSANHLTVGFVVEDDAKAERYIAKLRKLCLFLEITYRGPGPVKGTVLVKVRTKQD